MELKESYNVYDLADAYKELDYFCNTFGWEMYFINDTKIELFHKVKGIKIIIEYVQYNNFDSYKSYFILIDPSNIKENYNAKDEFFKLINNTKGLIVLYR